MSNLQAEESLKRGRNEEIIRNSGCYNFRVLPQDGRLDFVRESGKCDLLAQLQFKLPLMEG